MSTDVGRPLVSVVVLPGGTDAERDATIASAREQRDVTIEIADASDGTWTQELRGTFVAPIAAGDRFAPGKLGTQVAALERSSSVLALGDYRRVTPRGALIDEVRAQGWSELTPLIVYDLPPAAAIVVRHDALLARLETEPTARADDPLVVAAVLAARGSTVTVHDHVAEVVATTVGALDRGGAWLRDWLPVVRDSELRSRPHASVVRRDLLARLYLDLEGGCWRRARDLDLWGFGDEHRTSDPGTSMSESEHQQTSDERAIAERDAVIGDLQWTLDRQAEQFTATNVPWADAITDDDRVGEFPDQVLADREETIVWLHTEVANREATIASLHAELAERDARLASSGSEASAPIAAARWRRAARVVVPASVRRRLRKHPGDNPTT